MKDKEGLNYPSNDVVQICIVTEKYLKKYSKKSFNKMLIITNLLKSFINNNAIFDSIKHHND